MANLSWFPFSLLAVILFGVAMAFYKLPSAKGINKAATIFWIMFVSFLLSLILFYSFLPLSTQGMLLAAAAWGIAFTLLSLFQMYVLAHIETNVLFPISTTSSLVIAIIAAFTFFQEDISFIQFFGIGLVILSVFLFLYKKGKLQYSMNVLILGSVIIFLSAFNRILQKIVADTFDIHAYQIYQYGFGTLFALLLFLSIHRKNWKLHFSFASLKVGSMIGIVGFFGGYAFLTALTKGPFSLITSIHSLYIFITALTGYLLFKERLTKKKIVLLFLAIVAILLIRLG